MDKWTERRLPQKKRENDIRSDWERDYARIIHSAAFRRLQNKTQVLGLGENDFYRTRLTHSMEVTQIGFGIVKILENKYKNDINIKNALPDNSLIGAICLAHDIGHPPFGHSGEIALNSCMKKYGGFEANGHTLRILSKLENYTEKCGANPTRRMLLGVIKYPAPYSKVCNQTYYDKGGEKPPKCYLDSENDIVEWIFSPFENYEKELFQEIVINKDFHNKTIYKALDTSIMEIADDISYGLHDFEDAVTLKMINREKWEDYFKDKKDIVKSCDIEYEKLTEDIFSPNFVLKNTIGMLVNKMITAVEIYKLEQFKTPILKYNAGLKAEEKALLKCFQDIVVKHVITQINARHLMFKGKKFITELFNTFQSRPELLPDEKSSRLSEKGDIRIICDYMAGMTDDYAIRIYEKLFMPRKGSFFDKI